MPVKPHLLLLPLLTAAAAHGADLINTEAQFSGVQGQDGLISGYRNFTTTGTAVHYDPLSDFIPFAGGAGMGPWDAASQHWSGTAWDLNTASAAPWTYLAALSGHPAGTNQTGTFNGQPLNQEHWTIRRWMYPLSDTTPVALHCYHAKNSFGGGTTVLLAINGRVVDVSTRLNSSGTRVFYANLAKRDIVDLCLTPQGTSGSRGDSSDTTDFRLIADLVVPSFAVRPNGSFFASVAGPDTDGDGLNDDWEYHFFPGNLNKLGNHPADYDRDKLSDADEMAIGTHPNDVDSDNDGLRDGHEYELSTDPWRTDTDWDGLSDSAELNASNPSNPVRWDTDGDTFHDAEEVQFCSNPNASSDTPFTYVIADSAAEASGVQGQSNWLYGYRNFTTSGGSTNYNPAPLPAGHFIPFSGGSNVGTPTPTSWNGITQQWSSANNAWELTYPNTEGSSPWTSIRNDTWAHPSGPNQYHTILNEHWAIRRWVNELTVPSAVSLLWHTRKQNTNSLGLGVTGGVWVNGIRIDSATIVASDTTGVTRRAYVNLNPGAVVDLVLTPEGPTGDRKDEADGSWQWLRVDRRIPVNPVQPSGATFVPIAPPGFAASYTSFDPVTGNATIQWGSYPCSRYRVRTSTDLVNWTTTTVIAEGLTTQHVIPGGETGRVFVKVSTD